MHYSICMQHQVIRCAPSWAIDNTFACGARVVELLIEGGQAEALVQLARLPLQLQYDVVTVELDRATTLGAQGDDAAIQRRKTTVRISTATD
jgi:hypothetical protein